MTKTYQIVLTITEAEIKQEEETVVEAEIQDEETATEPEPSNETAQEVNVDDNSTETETVKEVVLLEEEKPAPVEKIEALQEDLLVNVVGLSPDIVVPPMTNEQVQLAKLPAAEIPITKLFTPVPLEARMTSGV